MINVFSNNTLGSELTNLLTCKAKETCQWIMSKIFAGKSVFPNMYGLGYLLTWFTIGMQFTKAPHQQENSSKS